MARNKNVDEAKTRPFLKKLAATKPITQQNSVDMNLQLYDQYKRLERGELDPFDDKPHELNNRYRHPDLDPPADFEHGGGHGTD